MTQPNQSELEKILYTYRFDSQAVDEDLVLQQDTVRVEEAHLDNLKEVTDYITANYTSNTTVEQLKSRIAWLEGKLEEATEVYKCCVRRWRD